MEKNQQLFFFSIEEENIFSFFAPSPHPELLQKAVSGSVNNAALLPTGTERIGYRCHKCQRCVRKVIGDGSDLKNKGAEVQNLAWLMFILNFYILLGNGCS